MRASRSAAQQVKVQESDWRTYPGKGVTVSARQESYATQRAPAILHAAERVIEALKRLLAPAEDRAGGPVAIYLADPLDMMPGGIPGANAAGDGQGRLMQTASDGDALICLVQPEVPGEPPVRPLTHLLISRWFGPEAASAVMIVDGIAGLVAARTRTGPPVEQADQWVQSELEAGRPVSLRARSETDSAIAPQTPAGFDPVATSFVAFLAANSGAGALHKYLAKYDPDRQDKAALAAFKQPLGVLEETWLTGLRRRAESSGNPFRSLLPRLLPLVRPYRRQQLEILVYLLLAGAFNVVPSLSLKYFTDNITKPNAATFLPRFLLILFVLYSLNSLVSLRRTYTTSWLSQHILNGMQERMFAHLQRLSHNYWANAKIGDVMARLSGDLQNVQQAMDQVTNKGLYQIFALLGCLAAFLKLSSKSPLLTVLILLLIPLFAASFFALRTRNKQASRDQRKRLGETTTMLQEYLSAQAVVKAFRMEKRVIAAYQDRLTKQMQSALRLKLFSALTDMNEDLVLAFARLMVFGIGGYFLISHRQGLGLGDINGIFLLLAQIFGPIAALSGIGQTLQQASGAMERVTALFDEPVAIADKPGAIALPPLAHEIHLDNVVFGYGGTRSILRGLTLTIPVGFNVAFVGPTGCGKSTTISLLTRFWDPEGGRVLFDGHDLRDVTLESLRGQIGLVFQDTFIFDTTVMENIRLSRPGASDAEVIAAARAARLDGDICDPNKFPAGYDTVLGERGGRMSGGQRQRLAIARAILRDPRILILDEATSALDAKTEAEILETLSELARNRTTISITHRLSWAAKADLIFVLDKGQLAEQGTHEQLVGAGGLYQRLYEEQTGFAVAPRPAESIDVDWLRAVPVFAGLSGDALALLGQKLQKERYGPGTDIIRQGEIGDKLYLIGQGQVDVLLMDKQGERRVNTLSEGDYFGEMALRTDEPRSATVRATMPAVLYSLSKEDFSALLQREPGIREAVSETVAARRAALTTVIAGANAPVAAPTSLI